MKNKVLSIDQMKSLKDAGIDTSSAAMYWTFPTHPEMKTKLTPVGINGNLKSWEDNGHGIGAFTLQDLLAIMPASIRDKNIEYFLSIRKNYSGYRVAYNTSGHGSIAFVQCNSLIESAYQSLLWVIQHHGL